MRILLSITWVCFGLPGEVSISMGNMVNEFLQELDVTDDTHAESPAASHLYIIDESEVMLDDKTSKQLHSSVAKALYMAKRGKPDSREFLNDESYVPEYGRL